MIESFLMPPYLTELSEQWCENIPQLNNINVLPKNPRYSMFENILLIDKSNTNSLIFCVRDISIIVIPDFIEIFAPYSFQSCKCLQELVIPIDSKLKIIDKYAFSESSLRNILIPSQLKMHFVIAIVLHLFLFHLILNLRLSKDLHFIIHLLIILLFHKI